MKILFVTPVVPSQTDGRRPFNFIKYLAPKHTIHLICLRLPQQSPATIRDLLEMRIAVTAVDIAPYRSYLSCLRGFVERQPLQVSWCRSPELRHALERTLARESFDLVHIDRMRMGQYAPGIRIPKVIDCTDSLVMYFERSLPYRRSWGERFVDRWELSTYPRFEQYALRHVDAAVVCSPIDADVFRKHHPDKAFEVIENAVDAEQFMPRSHGNGHTPRCVMTGTLFYFPNIDAGRYYAEEILPLIRKTFPGLETRIIGSRPKREVSALDGRWGMQVLADVPRMEEHLFQDDIYLCPIRVATGIRNKLLEAMAAGMPIVTTALGAEGLDLKPEHEALFAEIPDQFREQVERLMNSPELRQTLGQNARRYVLEKHNIEIVGAKLERLYERLVATGG